MIFQHQKNLEVGEFELGEAFEKEAVFEGVGIAWQPTSGTFGHGESVVIANVIFIILYIFIYLSKWEFEIPDI